MSRVVKSTDFALDVLRNYPRVSLTNIRGLEHLDKKKKKKHWRRRDFGIQSARLSLPHLGHEGGQSPYYMRHRIEFPYRGEFLRRQYPPLSLFELQRMVDTGRIDPTKPIDLAALCNSNLYRLDPMFRHSGVNLTEDGIEIFQARLNLEVQWTTESVIAAVERNGGTITTAYYDPESIIAMYRMVEFFKKGEAVPRRDIPPENCLEFYSSAQFRGYLADPTEVSKARVELAQKFGYELPNFETYEPALREMLLKRKDPRQIFYGLLPGWVVNLRDRKVLRPKHEELVEYFRA